MDEEASKKRLEFGRRRILKKKRNTFKLWQELQSIRGSSAATNQSHTRHSQSPPQPQKSTSRDVFFFGNCNDPGLCNFHPMSVSCVRTTKYSNKQTQPSGYGEGGKKIFKFFHIWGSTLGYSLTRKDF